MYILTIYVFFNNVVRRETQIEQKQIHFNNNETVLSKCLNHIFQNNDEAVRKV